MEKQAQKRIPYVEGFLTSPLSDLEKVRLKGTRCRSCGEVHLGEVPACKNCQSAEMESLLLSNRGKLYSYTIVRYRPPGDYKGPDVPFAVGMIELPEGLRLLAPLEESDFEKLKVDGEVELVVHKLFEDEDANEVIAYRFKLIS